MSRKREAESSLELLLDTICNTFGGVIFMAILVVILVQMTSRSEVTDSPSPAQDELAEVEQRRSESQAKLDTLRRTAKQQAELLKQFTGPDNRELLNKLQRMQSSREKLTDDRSKSMGQVSQSQMKANEIAEDLKRMEQAIRHAREALAAAEEAMRNEATLRTRTARHSIMRPTKKQEMGLFLRRNRLFQMYTPGSGGYTLNTADWELRANQIVLKPSGGKPIQGNAQGALNGVLAGYDKTAHCLAVFVWPDSFDEFAPLREAMVHAGFEYRLEPMPENKEVNIGSGSGPTYVQ